MNSSPPLSTAYMRRWPGFRICSDNGLSPIWRQATIWYSAGKINWTLRNELEWKLNRNARFLFKKIPFNLSSVKVASVVSRGDKSNNVKLTWIFITFPDSRGCAGECDLGMSGECHIEVVTKCPPFCRRRYHFLTICCRLILKAI